MKSTEKIAIAILMFLGLVACQGKASSESNLFFIPTATPGSRSAIAPTNNLDQPPEDYVISAMPHCPGLTDLGAPLKFDWPDIENALEKLADYNWGYYTCAMSAGEVNAFLHDKMLKPPYLWREVNSAQHLGGKVTLYYQPFSITFLYVWVLPRPEAQTAYLIIARGDPGIPQTWECRQSFPEYEKNC